MILGAEWRMFFMWVQSATVVEHTGKVLFHHVFILWPFAAKCFLIFKIFWYVVVSVRFSRTLLPRISVHHADCTRYVLLIVKNTTLCWACLCFWYFGNLSWHALPASFDTHCQYCPCLYHKDHFMTALDCIVFVFWNYFEISLSCVGSVVPCSLDQSFCQIIVMILIQHVAKLLWFSMF